MSKLKEVLTRDFASEKQIMSLLRIGLVTLFVCPLAAVWLWYTELSGIKWQLGINEISQSVVQITPENFNPKNNGKPIYISGMTSTVNDLVDPVFNFQISAYSYTRVVEMYQWKMFKESKRRRGLSRHKTQTYSKKVWSSRVESYLGPEENPSRMPIQTYIKKSSSINIGKFRIDEKFFNYIHNSMWLSPSNIKSIPQINGMNGVIKGNYIYYNKSDLNNNLGDIRVHFEVVPLRFSSLVGVQTKEKEIVPFLTNQNFEMALLREGKYSMEDLLANQYQRKGENIWRLRVLVFLTLTFLLNFLFSSAFEILSEQPELRHIKKPGIIFTGLTISLPIIAVISALARRNVTPTTSNIIFISIGLYLTSLFLFKIIVSRQKYKKSKKFKKKTTRMYKIHNNGKSYGPYSLEKLLSQLDKGNISLVTQISPVGSKKILRVADLVQNSKKAA